MAQSRYLSKVINDVLTSPALEAKDKKFDKLLADLQPNILQHHRKEHSKHIFISFKDKTGAREWISGLTKELKRCKQVVFSAKEQLDRRNKEAQEEKFAASFYLTVYGYRFMEVYSRVPRVSSSFLKGFEKDKFSNFSQYQNDLFPDVFNEERPIHAMLLLAHNDLDTLENNLPEPLGKKLKELEDIAVPVEQWGLIRHVDEGKKFAADWFGYNDGISQPRFFPDLTKIKRGSKVQFRLNEISSLDLVLTGDPGGKDMGSSAGSYLAFLKLEQDVEAFKTLETSIANEFLDGDTKLAKAHIIGRFEDGTPLTLANKENTRKGASPENDFDYTEILKTPSTGKIEADESGSRCPLFSHIRKTNPRSQNSKYESKKIARRGVLYNDIENKEGEETSQNKGMLFMSFQSNIEEQFEYIVNSLMLSNTTDGRPSGRDILTSDPEKTWERKLPDAKGQMQEIKVDRPLITFKGGAYFFTPSISFLESLSGIFSKIPTAINVANPGGEDLEVAKPKMKKEPVKELVKEPETSIFTPDGNIILKPVKFDNTLDKKIEKLLKAGDDMPEILLLLEEMRNSL